MGDIESSTSVFSKGKAALAASPYQTGPTAAKVTAGPSTKTTELTVCNLQSLSPEILDILLARQAVVEEQISRSFAEKAIPMGIYKVDGQIYWVCPKTLFNEDSDIGAMIASFAHETGATIKQIDVTADITKVYSDLYLKGLWFGMFSSTNQKRRRGKQDYELGRTCTFSLIVKNMFEAIAELGPRALTRDNFFFGNNGEEVSGKSRVPFFIKTKLRSFFENPAIGDLIYGIINYTAAQVGFKNLTLEEQDKVIMDHLIPVDSLITSCYTTTVVKRGRSEVTKIRKPNPIRSSPLFIREEMELVSSISSLIFADLAALTENYEETVFDLGFDALERRIKDSIRLRWETLQRFANRTKIRLQDIRKISNNPTLRKANVTQDHVRSLLTTTPEPVNRLVQEVRHIIGKTDLRDCLAYAYKKKFDSTTDAVRYLYIKILDIYRNVDLQNPSIVNLKPDQPAQEPLDIDFNNSIKSIIKIKNKIGSLKKQSSGIGKLKHFKLFGRIEQLENLITSLFSEVQSIMKQDKNSRDIAIKLYSEGQYSTIESFLTEAATVIEKTLSRDCYSLGWYLQDELDDKVRNLVTRFIQRYKDVDVESTFFELND